MLNAEPGRLGEDSLELPPSYSQERLYRLLKTLLDNARPTLHGDWMIRADSYEIQIAEYLLDSWRAKHVRR